MSGPAFGLLPGFKDATTFGVAAIRIDEQPRDDAPVTWSTYPSGMDRAAIAATRGVSPRRVLLARPASSDAKGKKGSKWHGFGQLADGFNMLDPIKATIVTPGLNLDGKFDKTGIPASIVTKFLAEHGVVVEKTGLYSFFIMFTIGITKGRWNTLLTALQQFKDDYDKNQPLWRILPEFIAKHPRYERMGLRDLCQSIHETYAKGDIARLTTEMYLSDLHPAMKPSDAYAHIAQRRTERVEVDALEGRITTALLTPYPPGIPLLIPGERFNRKIVDYLKFTREFNAAFPGFATDVHGLVSDDEAPVGTPKRYYVDCVKS